MNLKKIFKSYLKYIKLRLKDSRLRKKKRKRKNKKKKFEQPKKEKPKVLKPKKEGKSIDEKLVAEFKSAKNMLRLTKNKEILPEKGKQNYLKTSALLLVSE